MADLSVEAGLTPDDLVLTAVSKLFTHLWNAAWDEASGTAQGDADALHDMRVALRRLRSALQNFEGSREAPLLNKRVRREFAEERSALGKLGDLLGAVRDHDVLDDYLKDYAKSKNISLEAAPGLLHFERYLQTERAQSFAPMVRKINRALEPGRSREEFARWALGLPAMAGVPPLTLREAAHIIIPLRVDEVYAHAFALSNGSDSEGHHEFRKTLRRLRYALETMSVCFNKPVKPLIKQLVSLQDALGEMQDRAVLEETAYRAFPAEKLKAVKSSKNLAAIDEDGDAATPPSSPPLPIASCPLDVVAFIKFGEMRRRRLLGQVRAFWKEHETGGVFDEIRELGEKA